MAIAAQGLDRPRPTKVTARHIGAIVDRLHVIQIDSVNVVARAHYLPFFARLGNYDRSLLARLYPDKMVEYWAHEASFIAPETLTLLRWRMAHFAGRPGWFSRIYRDSPEIVAQVQAALSEHGPSTARQISAVIDHDRPADEGNWGWNYSAAKSALEWLFAIGEVTVAGRNPSFERIYDFPAAVLPKRVLDSPVPTREDAIRTLVEMASRAHGVGTTACLADYFRVPNRDAATAVSQLVEDGVLTPVAVEGWEKPAFLHRDARVPRAARAQALLAPFDPMVFERGRLEALFGMRYRIEIYTPAAKRVHGYYVLPFLLGESMVARVDLKADRQAGVLRVQAAHFEGETLAGATVARGRSEGLPDRGEVETALRCELETMVEWLGLLELDFSGLR